MNSFAKQTACALALAVGVCAPAARAQNSQPKAV